MDLIKLSILVRKHFGIDTKKVKDEQELINYFQEVIWLEYYEMEKQMNITEASLSKVLAQAFAKK